MSDFQRHILRDKRPSTAACPACWAITKVMKKLFCTGPTRAAKAEQNLVYWQDKPNEPTKEGLSRGSTSLISLFLLQNCKDSVSIKTSYPVATLTKAR
jgi:hypothetical protein